MGICSIMPDFSARRPGIGFDAASPPAYGLEPVQARNCRRPAAIRRSFRDKDNNLRNSGRRSFGTGAVGSGRRTGRWRVAPVLAAAMIAAGQAAAAPCLPPAERQVFEMAALKSEMMVAALICQASDRYNEAVLRFRPGMLAYDQALLGYFQRTYGAAGQRRHDDYITQLANTRSHARIALGEDYCQERLPLFGEIMALPAGSDLGKLAMGKAFGQTSAPAECRVSGKPQRAAAELRGSPTAAGPGRPGPAAPDSHPASSPRPASFDPTRG